MKGVVFESFQNVNGQVKVMLKMVFAASNADPAAALKASIADGMLGPYAVDPSSLEFAEVKGTFIQLNDLLVTMRPDALKWTLGYFCLHWAQQTCYKVDDSTDLQQG